MGSEWSSVRFGDLYAEPSRNGLTKPKRVRGQGVKFVNMGEIFAHDRMSNISCDRAPLTEKESLTSLLKPLDLLFARQSLVLSGAGKCSLFIEDTEPVAFESHPIRVRLEQKKVVPEFLYYFFKSPLGRDSIYSIVEQGAGASGIRGSDLTNLDVLVPALPEQRAIVHMLGTLDDRIELNRRMNETLEAMAQALFKSWFVDFDPVIDNALAASKEIPAELSEKAQARADLGDKRRPLPEEIRTLFPDEFTYNDELGWIPKGWEVGLLRDIAENPRRGVQATDINAGTPYIGLQDMPQKSISLTSWGWSDEVTSSKFSFHRGEILFGKLRPYFHKVGIAPVDGVCSTDILVVLPKKDEWFSVVFGHVTSLEFIEYVTAASTGTKMPRTNWKDMGSYGVVVPGQSVTKKLTEHFQEYIVKILLNIEQNKKLSKLLDTLLPKLLSGEIRIPDAEKMVEELAL